MSNQEEPMETLQEPSAQQDATHSVAAAEPVRAVPRLVVLNTENADTCSVDGTCM
ncbi:hypothetical protein Pth03_60290 [Planotetraspora thailandica]|uniref:Uncharacterized protein n=1 Tax=Planotetraspora thailandica TaxID=487172 RepID=A0A8J3V7U7_9ACTN|nr:hypothetical protein [Planotetraspora thailandica]GII57640.1 hypothetical protein Pth03_60290 [Planotetraspora thailandica]